jgi:NAD(P)H-dependent FMN reductase
MDELYIPVVLGTAREGRRSDAVARFVHRVVVSKGVKSDLVDVRDFPLRRTMRADTEPLLSWRSIADDADAFMIVAPEYNHGYPGELKLLLDSAYWEYVRKPVGIVGVSNGAFGAARMVEQLRLVAMALGMVPIREAVYFQNVAEVIGDDGEIDDRAYARRTGRLLDDLVWFAQALEGARSEPESEPGNRP